MWRFGVIVFKFLAQFHSNPFVASIFECVFAYMRVYLCTYLNHGIAIDMEHLRYVDTEC